MLAADGGHVCVVQLLLDHGADINARDIVRTPYLPLSVIITAVSVDCARL